VGCSTVLLDAGDVDSQDPDAGLGGKIRSVGECAT
jgi:hypothetical protein